jgi:mannose-6-phosphate isomerase-like protein (cupin superfamily)
LSGAASKELEGNNFTIHSNQGIHIPAGLKHQLSNQHEDELVFTVTPIPPSHGERMEV